MAGLILDSGALIAYERNDRRLWVAFKAQQKTGDPMVIPALVLAQVWRDRRQVALARLIKACNVVAFDLSLARRVGELCGTTETNDIVDAAVALGALDYKSNVATSDPTDIRILMQAAGATGRILPM